MGVMGIIMKSGAKRLGKSVGKMGTENNPYAPTPERLRQWAHELSHDHVIRIDGKDVTLAKDEGVCKEYLQSLIAHGKSAQLKEIIAYLKSSAAENLSRFDRAQLIHAAMEKMDVLKLMSDLFT